MNDRICLIQKYIPKQFGRKLRTFEELERFKATEFRQLLLYTGKIIFKNILNAEYYDHFISLNIAIKNMGCYLSEEDDFYFTYICVDKLIKPSMCIYNIDCYFKKLIFMTLFHNIL